LAAQPNWAHTAAEGGTAFRCNAHFIGAEAHLLLKSTSWQIGAFAHIKWRFQQKAVGVLAKKTAAQAAVFSPVGS
jgi:hypothetical protein